MNTESLSEIIAAVGPAVPELSSILMRGEDEWLLSFVDLDVTVEYDRESDCIMLSGNLDPLPAANREAVLTTLMTYSFLWRDTGGLYVALRAKDSPVLMLPLAGSELAADFLSIVLANFASRIRDISSLVSAVAEGGGKQSSVPSGGIKV